MHPLKDPKMDPTKIHKYIHICIYMYMNYTDLCTHVLGPFPEALWAEVGGLLLWSSMSGLFVRLAGDSPKSLLVV